MHWDIFCFQGLDDGAFERDVARAAALGATHVGVGSLPAKPRHEKTDPDDPYLEYSFVLGCLFRFVVPDELRVMTPADYERETFGALQRRCAVLRQHGLRGWLWLLEPHAWPDEVFDAHPEWRGPRVEFPPRARRAYWAPCIDHPEVLALYRRSVQRLCSACPEIDTFRLTTNDSGAGICWSAKLYSGPNGPTACAGRPYGQRVAGFLQAWIDGAADAGVTASVRLSPRGMSDEQAEAARLAQPPRCHVLPQPAGFPNASASAGGPTGSIGVANPIELVQQLTRSLTGNELSVSLHGECDWRLLDRFVRQPARTMVRQAELLTDMAGEIVRPEQAERLLDVWQRVRTALGRIAFMPWGSLLFMHGMLSKRWITWPLVVFPGELTDEECRDWKPHLFHGGNPGELHHLTNIHATIMMEGVPQAYAHRQNCLGGCGELRAAADRLDELAASATGDWPPRLRLQAARLRGTACLFRTVGNVPLFAAFVQRVHDDDAVGTDLTAFYCYGGPIRKELNQLVRDEMENAQRLAELIEASREPVLAMARRPEDEDCFTLGPDLAGQLRRKARIMNAHLMDVGRLLPFPSR